MQLMLSGGSKQMTEQPPTARSPVDAHAANRAAIALRRSPCHAVCDLSTAVGKRRQGGMTWRCPGVRNLPSSL